MGATTAAIAALEGSLPPSAPSSSSSLSTSNGDSSEHCRDGIAAKAAYSLSTPSPPTSSPPVPLSATERAAIKEAAIKNFNIRVTELPEKKLQALFTAVSYDTVVFTE
jgi:hypothetical protein